MGIRNPYVKNPLAFKTLPCKLRVFEFIEVTFPVEEEKEGEPLEVQLERNRKIIEKLEQKLTELTTRYLLRQARDGLP